MKKKIPFVCNDFQKGWEKKGARIRVTAVLVQCRGLILFLFILALKAASEVMK